MSPLIGVAGETANGSYPDMAVRTMAHIVEYAELGVDFAFHTDWVKRHNSGKVRCPCSHARTPLPPRATLRVTPCRSTVPRLPVLGACTCACGLATHPSSWLQHSHILQTTVDQRSLAGILVQLSRVLPVVDTAPQAPVSPLEATLAGVAKSAVTFSMDANGDGVLDASEGKPGPRLGTVCAGLLQIQVADDQQASMSLLTFGQHILLLAIIPCCSLQAASPWCSRAAAAPPS